MTTRNDSENSFAVKLAVTVLAALVADAAIPIDLNNSDLGEILAHTVKLLAGLFEAAQVKADDMPGLHTLAAALRRMDGAQ